MTQQIKAIYGIEPMREGEYPMAHVVGLTSHINGRGPVRVDRIERREENYGDHGLSWFDILSGGVVVASVQARAVGEIHYSQEENA